MNIKKWNWQWVSLFAVVILVSQTMFWGYELFGQFNAMLGNNTLPTLSEILVTLIPLNILVPVTGLLGVGITVFLIWHWIDLGSKIEREQLYIEFLEKENKKLEEKYESIRQNRTS